MTRILAILAYLESSGNPAAVNGEAVGLYQITPVVVADLNRITGKGYTLADREVEANARLDRPEGAKETA